MSLIDELRERGVTREDLERAAAVRLFEKAAAAESVDLNQISEDQVERLFQEFVTPTSTKEASTMADQNVDAVIDLFTKTASDEGVDLDQFTEEQVDALFDYFVEEILPGMLAEEGAEKEASDKLAEAEILGRHMARAYMDELEKNASKYTDGPLQIGKSNLRYAGARLKELATGHQAAGERAAARLKKKGTTAFDSRFNDETAKNVTGRFSTDGGKKVLRQERLKGYAKRVGVVGGTAAAAVGGKALMDKKASSEEVMAEATARANQFIGAGSIEAHDGSFIDDLALDLLKDNGYTWDN